MKAFIDWAVSFAVLFSQIFPFPHTILSPSQTGPSTGLAATNPALPALADTPAPTPPDWGYPPPPAATPTPTSSPTPPKQTATPEPEVTPTPTPTVIPDEKPIRGMRCQGYVYQRIRPYFCRESP